MKFPTTFFSSFLFLILVLFQGCTVVGPDFTPAPLPVLPQKYDQNLTKSDPKILEWWKQFNDPTLDSLVQKAYDQNLDLESASVRILSARAALGLSESLTTPQKRTLNASLMGVRNSGETFGTHGVSFDSGWELDVWGKYARGIEGSEAAYYASIASYDDILVTIISEVARNYINYRTYQERIRYSQQNIEIQQRVVRMTEVQFNSGTVSELDMQQARSQLYALQANLPNFELQSTQALHAIAVLLGTIPEVIKTTIQDHAPAPVVVKPTTKKSSFVQLSNEVQVPSTIPTITLDINTPINAGDLLNRPDLRIAQLQSIAKNAQIGTAKADLYPHFSLVGSIGFNANSASGSWTTPANALTVGIGPSISWNPFYADFYQNQVRIADAQFQESLINYNSHILKAVQEVSNATQGYLLTSQQYELNKKAIHASRRAFNLSSIQYDNGMVTYQRLLNTMETLTRNEDNIAITRGNIALHAISLYKALGGGLKIASDQPLLHPNTAKTMRERTDWGNLLDTNQTRHPKVGN
jgi:NodT family efflux transporter outer membrane factor (OMF) lipoprotein